MAGKLDQDAAGNEILRTSGGRSVAGRPFWRRGAWLATVWVLGQRRWLEALGTGRGAGGGSSGRGELVAGDRVLIFNVLFTVWHVWHGVCTVMFNCVQLCAAVCSL